MHVNVFEKKTNEELSVLYGQFLNAEKSTGFSENNELGKIKKEYEKDFGANTVLMLQIELTRTIADRWFAEAEIGFIPRIRGNNYDFTSQSKKD
jgi:hypothetical protein